MIVNLVLCPMRVVDILILFFFFSFFLFFQTGAIHTVVLGIRARRAVDKKDTVRRITSWLHDVVDKAVDIGYQWEVESTTEAMAWACGTSFLDQGKCTGVVSWV